MWKGDPANLIRAMMCNGMLAGLVAITAPAHSERSCGVPYRIDIGVLVIEASFFVERVLKVTIPSERMRYTASMSMGVLWWVVADGTYGDGWNGVPGTVTGVFYGNSSSW
jgi:Amt family ammonium transporter